MMSLNTYYAKRRTINVAAYKRCAANLSDCDKLITESCIYKLEDQPPVMYFDGGPNELVELLPHLKNLDYSLSTRLALGTSNYSLLFGAVPSKINRSNFCSFGAVAAKDTELHSLLTNKYSVYLDALLTDHLPNWSKVFHSLYNEQDIHSDYRMATTNWTSGIINHNSPHKYHFDGLNVRKMISAMITFKDGCDGGFLCFPEYGIAFEVRNGSSIFFSGSTILHGVSPLNLSANGHRFSIVYYTTKSLELCDSYENEIEKALKR